MNQHLSQPPVISRNKYSKGKDTNKYGASKRNRLEVNSTSPSASQASIDDMFKEMTLEEEESPREYINEEEE